MGEGTYVDGMVKENFTPEVIFTVQPKRWQGLLYTKSQKKSISGRSKYKGKDSKMGKSFRCLREWRVVKAAGTE